MIQALSPYETSLLYSMRMKFLQFQKLSLFISPCITWLSQNCVTSHLMYIFHYFHYSFSLSNTQYIIQSIKQYLLLRQYSQLTGALVAQLVCHSSIIVFLFKMNEHDIHPDNNRVTKC